MVLSNLEMHFPAGEINARMNLEIPASFLKPPCFPQAQAWPASLS